MSVVPEEGSAQLGPEHAVAQEAVHLAFGRPLARRALAVEVDVQRAPVRVSLLEPRVGHRGRGLGLEPEGRHLAPEQGHLDRFKIFEVCCIPPAKAISSIFFGGGSNSIKFQAFDRKIISANFSRF